MVIDTLVVIKEDNIPPLQWKLGRITDLSMGPDGHVRVAEVRTSSGTLRRAIHNLAPLPIEVAEDAKYNSTSIQQVQDTENQQREQSRKRQRKGSSYPSKKSHICSTLTTLLVIALICPLILATKSSNINIQRLSHSSGLFYDHQGELQISPTQWTIMAFLNLDGFWALDNGIETLLKRMRMTSEIISQQGPYKDSINHVAIQFDHARQYNNVILEHFTTRRRTRRAAFNIVGTVFNKLFGTLDDDYAQDMKTTIEKIHGNEMQLQELFNIHTAMLDATINVIKRQQEDIRNRTIAIKRVVDNALLNLSNTISRELRESQTIEYFILLAAMCSSYLSEYEQIQDDIADITFGLHQGHTSMHIISPIQLQTQLEMIQKNLPPALVLPHTHQSEL